MLQDLPEPETLKILVVDDHELILSGTIDLLKRQYPQAEIFTAKTTQNALQQKPSGTLPKSIEASKAWEL
jgi:DNA-binding NarL/FixJ family response regulator